MYLSRGLKSPLPETDLIAAVQAEIQNVAREHFEPWRFEISERFIKSGAQQAIFDGVLVWVKQQIDAGRDQVVASGMTGGLTLCAFQLGYLVAIAQGAKLD